MQGRTMPYEESQMSAMPPVDTSYARAHALACEIEDLLAKVARAAQGTEGYSVRFAQAITRSLIDQLGELGNPPASAVRLKTRKAD
jgi:hypothetical protein